MLRQIDLAQILTRPQQSTNQASNRRCAFALNATIAFAAFFVPSPFLVAQESYELRDGTRRNGTLRSIDSDWNLRLESDERQFVVRLDVLDHYGRFEGTSITPLVLLQGGDLIAGEIVDIGRQSVTISSRYWKLQEIPREYIKAILLQPAIDPMQCDREIVDLQNTNASEPQVRLLSGDVWQGPLANGSDNKVDPNDLFPDSVARVRIELESQSVELDSKLIKSVVFPKSKFRVEQTSASIRARIGFRDGSLLGCRTINESRDQIEIVVDDTLSFALRTDGGRETAWQQFVSLERIDATATSLTELEPIAYQSREQFGIKWPYTINHSVNGTRLRSQGAVIPSGIGMHADSTLAFQVPDGKKRLRGKLALDDTAMTEDDSTDRGSVVYRVYGSEDGDSWQEVFSSDLIQAGRQPVAFDVSVERYIYISLSVDHGDDSWILDRANWLGVRFE